MEGATHVVARPFEADGKPRLTGEVLDTTAWLPRRADALVNLRNLRAYDPEVDLAACDCGRLWVERVNPNHTCEESDGK